MATPVVTLVHRGDVRISDCRVDELTYLSHTTDAGPGICIPERLAKVSCFLGGKRVYLS